MAKGYVQANIDLAEVARLTAVEKAARKLVRLKTKRGLEVGSRMHAAVDRLTSELDELTAWRKKP